MNINNWLKFFNVRSNPIDLKAGTEYDIKLVPFQHIATDQVRKFHWERRDCFFPDEQACCIVTHIQFCIQLKKPKFQEEDSMFKTYSLKGCQFECKLTNTFKSVGCIPWDYPIPPSLGHEGNIPICNSSVKQGEPEFIIFQHPETSSRSPVPNPNFVPPTPSSLARFNDYMDSKKSVENCGHCIADCEQEVRFETQVSITYKMITPKCPSMSSTNIGFKVKPQS